MKQRYGRIAVLVAGLSLAIAGCLPVSLQPLYKESDVRFDPALLGFWSNPDDKDAKNTWTFEKGEKQSYKLILTEGTNASPFIAHLFVLGEQRFLDLFPHEDGLKETKLETTYKVALIPGHLFLRVDQIEPVLKMEVMKIDWLKDYLKEHPQAVEHRWTSNNESFVLTDTTDALQAFVKAHLSDKDAWDNAEELKKSATPAEKTSSVK